MDKTMKDPLVSVVMPIYNSEKYLAKAIDSILTQTYSNFELIIVDDGSTDQSGVIIKRYNDSRIQIIRHKTNEGVSASRNEAAAAAKGSYIAMHDADDISLPGRFDKQVKYLEQNLDIGVLGSSLKAIDEDDNFLYFINLLTNPDDLKLAEIFSNQIAQSSAMIRREIFKKSGGFNTQMTHAEDTDLWRRVSHYCQIANLKEPLCIYRVHPAGASANIAKIRESALATTSREFDYYLSHKKQYRFFAFHPFSMHGGPLVYMKRKSAMYGLMSLSYCYAGWRRKAISILILAILHAPWSGKIYRQAWLTITSRERILNYNYELF